LKGYFKNIQTLLIVVLAVLLFYQKSCSSTPPVEPQTITEVITRWDTLKVATKEYVPKYIRKTIVNIDTFQAPIDTMSILRDYYAKYFYTDTIKVDSLGFIVINDTVTRNLISKRDVQSNIFIPTTTITNTTYLYKRELFWGASVSGNQEQIQSINGELMYVNKKRNAYGFVVEVHQNIQPIFTGHLYWKIGK